MDRIPAIRRVILADRSAVAGALWAAAAVAVPTALGLAIGQGDLGVPFISYFPAVVLAGLLLGWRWGITVLVASGLVANWAFLSGPAAWSWSLQDIVREVLFVVTGAALVWIGEACRRLVREIEAAKQRETLLNHELMHRVKNMLATVNAMAVLTARHSPPGEFAKAFSGRMRALDRATELLGVGQNSQCEVAALVDGAVAPFRGDENFAVAGAPCHLPRDSCVPLSLALHELCTNAAKHGALSSREGQIELSWECNAAGLLSVWWRERGGPPVPEQRRAGMGTQLLRRQRGLRAVEVRFPPEGLECDIEIDGARPVRAAA